MASKFFQIELRDICLEEARLMEESWHRTYQHGGETYEVRMKEFNRLAMKWHRRSRRVLVDKVLQNAMIKWM